MIREDLTITFVNLHSRVVQVERLDARLIRFIQRLTSHNLVTSWWPEDFNETVKIGRDNQLDKRLGKLQNDLNYIQACVSGNDSLDGFADDSNDGASSTFRRLGEDTKTYSRRRDLNHINLSWSIKTALIAFEMLICWIIWHLIGSVTRRQRKFNQRHDKLPDWRRYDEGMGQCSCCLSENQ